MADPDFAQRTLLGLLLEEHPRILTLAEVEQRLSDVAGLDEAAQHLARDGLVSRVGDLIGASRVAVRGDQLSV